MTDTMVEGEIVTERALVRRDVGSAEMQDAGAAALAMMSDGEFEARLTAMKKGRERIDRINREMLREGVDYGVIPGTKNPTLLKPGAETLCQVYRLVADFVVEHEWGDGVSRPSLRVTVRCELHTGSLDGPVVAVGNGASNSWEKRYRYREGSRVCPTCGKVGTIIKGKEEFGGGWLCWAKKGGCGAKFEAGDPTIEDQQVGATENPDPLDLDVTLVKISEKRSYVDATLRALAISGLFTQDVEDTGVSNARRSAPPAQRQPAREVHHPSRGYTGTVEVEDGDFEPRQYAQGWAVLFHLNDGNGIGRVIWVSPAAKDLTPFENGAQVVATGEWSDKQNAVVATKVVLAPTSEGLADAALPETPEL